MSGRDAVLGVAGRANSIPGWFNERSHWHGTNGIPHRLEEHLYICAVSLLVAAVVAMPLAVALGHIRRGGTGVQQLTNIGRAIPSLAVLVLAVPFLGIGARPAELALILLAIPPLFTNTYAGMVGVDADVRDAALGAGMTAWQSTTRIELPLALPLILAGVRTAAFQVIATATLAAVIAYGGLGRYIVDGLAVQDLTQVTCGSILVIALALSVEGLFAGFQRVVVAPPLRSPSRSTPTHQLEESANATRLDPAT
ncbi:MAG: ABC transporter permease [Acidimicrobiales bacterium]